ncbi:MAG: hypothetical protein OXI87_06660 [Albidovulum sp.]|nr:hypothetical protein [Albidovulum sp.]MDE0531458.1 hypothetical protein [Albidovulum sp.]
MRAIQSAVLCQMAVSFFSALGFPELAFGDSTSGRAIFSIIRESKSSILGSTNDGMSCRFKDEDGLIHCIYGQSENTDWLASSVTEPEFNSNGNNRFGQFDPSESKSYAFLNAEIASDVGGGRTKHCKLTLQFVTTDNEIIWIWHDELRLDGSGQYAALDTNGDGIADKAVSGSWNGNLSGSSRWSPANATDNTFSDSERKFADRPVFGRINGVGRRRGCDATGVGIAEIQSAEGQIGTSVDGDVPVWRTETRP